MRRAADDSAFPDIPSGKKDRTLIEWLPLAMTSLAVASGLRSALASRQSRSTSSGNLFRAVLSDGSRVEGMVFPGALIRDGDPPPRANAELIRKRR